MNARHHRECQIAGVLLRHGCDFLLAAVGLEHLVEAERDLHGSHHHHPEHTRPEHLRLALEELGPTFIKLGQMLSIRPDLLPPEYRIELAKLQDAAPHLDPEVAREVILHELGDHVDSTFASFDFAPLAAASIGQAHAATLPDGTEVVVKVRRPGAVEEVHQDLEILQNCAVRASRRWEAAAHYDVVGLADEFAQTLRAELDYLQEGRNAERFGESFGRDPDVQVPRVFWETTTSRVITLERIRGMKITDLAALEAAGIDRHELADRATRMIAKMILEDGFFHADPHPGNFFIEAGCCIGIIDFGMVGNLSEGMRNQMGKLLLAMVRENPDRLADALLEMGTSTAPVDRAQLREDLAVLVDQFSRRTLAEVGLGEVSGDILEVVRRHRLRAPRELALLLKALIMGESLALELDPDYRIVDALAPYAYRHLAAELSPVAVVRRLEQVGSDLAELTVNLPGQFHRMLDVLAGGGLEVHLRASELEPLVERFERLGGRIAVSVLGAAVIDALAELAAHDRGQLRNGRTLRIAAAVGGVALGARAARSRARALIAGNHRGSEDRQAPPDLIGEPRLRRRQPDLAAS